MQHGLEVVLAPGASRGLLSLKPYVDNLAARGIDVRGISLSSRHAERSAREYIDKCGGGGSNVIVGGRSFGGRVASLAAADPSTEFAGVLAFAYPLHRPGAPHALRTEHWPRIRCPMLIVQGNSDPFGSPDDVRREMAKLAKGSLVVLPGAGHSLMGRLPEAVAAAAEWITSLNGGAR
ncbi:MAG: hypothetical protein NVSMB2_05620 [Chloroflexota bacterium]